MHFAAAAQIPQIALFGPTNPFHWRPRNTLPVILQGTSPIPVRDFSPDQPRSADEANLDGSSDRCYECAAVESGSARLMSKAEAAKAKLSFLQTMRVAWRPYLRLYSYVKPYKWRFAVGIVFGFAFGLVNGILAWVVCQVSSFIFHGSAPKERNHSSLTGNCWHSGQRSIRSSGFVWPSRWS